jgi:hypothetical protein
MPEPRVKLSVGSVKLPPEPARPGKRKSPAFVRNRRPAGQGWLAPSRIRTRRCRCSRGGHLFDPVFLSGGLAKGRQPMSPAGTPGEWCPRPWFQGPPAPDPDASRDTSAPPVKGHHIDAFTARGSLRPLSPSAHAWGWERTEPLGCSQERAVLVARLQASSPEKFSSTNLVCPRRVRTAKSALSRPTVGSATRDTASLCVRRTAGSASCLGESKHQLSGLKWRVP